MTIARTAATTTTRISHTPADMTQWVGRAELFETARARYWYQLAQPYKKQHIGLIGFACDQGVRRNQGRVGARAAPPLIRRAFATLPVIAELQQRFDGQLSTLLGDAGDIHCDDNDGFADSSLEQAQLKYANAVSTIVKQGGLPIGLGGGHAIAYGSFLGLWQALENTSEATISTNTAPTIGIINFDAHLDIRQSDVATSGTPFRQIAEHLDAQGQPFHYCCIGVSRFSNTAALFDRAEQLGVQVISDEDCHYQPWDTLAEQVKSFIDQVDIVYLTIDMDCLPSSVVPGVSAPAAFGIELGFVERMVKTIMASGKVKMADIAEINPTFDIDSRSCKVAARLLAIIVEQYLLSA
ncbi:MULTISPECIES: formimidoylglutamase [unclassified Psychrobacter]|uniref:formimidoylglutamase n=1 Tax=unclassified Psychrobacter TaxID=196806 RepID=UPI0025B3EAA9|nr:MULTISPECIES: formimidoylglutamase [unclassified Psychrobacter]MDN3453318.1 formimidoylglutamase [Psychrobacter sp. APC 3350]MDN3501610.1 formimidoylglutamase [Psychrobacter sp. 5A.1]